MRAYISISFSKRQTKVAEINAIVDTLVNHQIEPFVFMDQYHFELEQERLMMQQALQELDKCDLLIAETSDKAIGIGVEAGYAKAKSKPIIYIREINAAHSTTVSGISDFQINYLDIHDLTAKLTSIIRVFFL